MSVGSTILFDPSKEELAVADAVVAVSAAQDARGEMKMVALRTIDPPSRLTAAGVLNVTNSTTGPGVAAAKAVALRERDAGQTVWRPSRGGVSRGVIAAMIKAVLEKGGVAQEVMEGLQNVDV